MVLKGFIFLNKKQYFFFSFQIFSPCALRHLVHTEHSTKNARRQAVSHHLFPTRRSWPKHSDSVIDPVSVPAKCFGTDRYCALFCDLPLTAQAAHQGTFPFVLRQHWISLARLSVTAQPHICQHWKVLEIRTLCQTFLWSTSLYPVPHSPVHSKGNQVLELGETICSESMQRVYPRTEVQPRPPG